MIAAARYAQIQGETASRERLMVLLIERALSHMRNAATAFEEGRFGDGQTPLTKASKIVVELRASLDHSRAPALAGDLDALYEFVIMRLVRATRERSAAAIREAERAFAPIADAFAQAVASLPRVEGAR